MFQISNKIKPTLQAESAECGLACLAMICSYFGRSESLTELRRRYPTSLSGVNLHGLMATADKLGFFSRAVRCDLNELTKLICPAILHWDMDHFVVLERVTRGSIYILDPAKGRRALKPAEVSRHFTGVALELTPSPNFEKQKVVTKVALTDLWSRMSGFTPVLVQIFLLTFVLQAFSLIMPIANQIVIDDVIGRADKDLLFAILIGFGLVVLIQTAVEMLRSFIQLYAGQRLSMQLTGNLLRHMMKLPIEFFERRHVGDILTRFGSLQPVQAFLTGGIVGVALDALMVVPACIIMVLYSPLLSALVFFDLMVVTAVQFATFHRNKRFSDESLTLSAKTQSIFIETIRAMRAIKGAARESDRHSIWQNSVADQQNLTFRQSVFNLWGSSGFALVMGAQGLFLLYLGATEVILGHLSLGMLIAFQSYAGQFSGRAKSLIGQYFGAKMLSLHLERLGDIVQAEEEAGLEGVWESHRPFTGHLELRGVSFAYSPLDSVILKDLNFVINPGERVVFVGPSGGGKSTLFKILTGLYEPTSGDLLVDGVGLKLCGKKSYRMNIGIVMQDDQLLSGTIADNIAFFDPEIDMLKVEEVCRTSMIHEEIMRLPMAYNSLIGDMGSMLSGGQKQRILLARALYRNPTILFMDEGTANLDPELEEEILCRLQDLNITHIMVAHREAVVKFATKVFDVRNGSVIPLAGHPEKVGNGKPL